MKCCIPGCNKEIPELRFKMKRKIITCSKKCSSTWNHLNSKLREKIRGKKYRKKDVA